MITIGVDIGGSSVKTAAVSDGNVRCARSEPYRTRTRDEIVDRIRAAVRDLAVPTIDSVGLCLPGLRDLASGRILAAVNLPSLVGETPVSILAETGASAARVTVFTDAYAAAYDWWSRARPAGRLCAISIGTGAGMCVLDDGAPLRISGESSGHLGQVDVSWTADPPHGPDGARGVLEAYVGLPALSARFGEGIERALARLPPDDDVVLALARAVRIIHGIYRPGGIVLLGGVGIRLAPSLGAIRTAAESGLTSVARQGWRLECGNSDFHAACGAARLAGTSAIAARA